MPRLTASYGLCSSVCVRMDLSDAVNSDTEWIRMVCPFWTIIAKAERWLMSEKVFGLAGSGGRASLPNPTHVLEALADLYLVWGKLLGVGLVVVVVMGWLGRSNDIIERYISQAKRCAEHGQGMRLRRDELNVSTPRSKAPNAMVCSKKHQW